MIDSRIAKIAREIICQVDCGTITLTYLETTLSTFADDIRRNGGGRSMNVIAGFLKHPFRFLDSWGRWTILTIDDRGATVRGMPASDYTPPKRADANAVQLRLHPPKTNECAACKKPTTEMTTDTEPLCPACAIGNARRPC